MFRLLFHTGIELPGFDPKVCGVQAEHGAVMWESLVAYERAKQFVDSLNERNLPEEALFDAAWEFLMEQGELG